METTRNLPAKAVATPARTGPTFFELAQQALSSTEHGYDLLAPKFDVTPFRTPQPILDAVGRHLQSLAPFGSGLDLCCGTGAGMAMLRPLCSDRVVSLDFSWGMLDICRQNAVETSGSASLVYVRGDALELPFGPVFDIVVCFGAFGHIRQCDEPRFVAEIARVLRPGGRFVFVTGFRPPVWSRRFWFAWLFNLAMVVRNIFVTPPFIMYYLTFMLPEVRRLLQKNNMAVEERELGVAARTGTRTRGQRLLDRLLGLPESLSGLRLVIATKG